MIFDFLADYLSIIIFVIISLFLSLGFILLNYLASPKNPDPEKLSAYECGFEAFDDSRMEFDVRFYLVAILFIIFDLEIAFLFPWAISLGNLGEAKKLTKIKPMLKNKAINKNIIIDTKPNIPILPKEIAHGKRKAISKSKIINNIATK